MSTEQTPGEDYDKWMERVMAGRDNKPLADGEVVGVEEEKPFATVKFANTDRDHYYAEIGQKGKDFIFHFFCKPEGFHPEFEDKLGSAFLKVFKDESRLQAAFVPEFSSWAVRARDYALNPLAHDQAARVFDELDKELAA